MSNHLSERQRARYREACRAGATHEQAMQVARGRMLDVRTMRLDLPLALDEVAQCAIAQHPSGVSLDYIAELYGVSDELIRIVERAALRKVRERINPREFAYLAERCVA